MVSSSNVSSAYFSRPMLVVANLKNVMELHMSIHNDEEKTSKGIKEMFEATQKTYNQAKKNPQHIFRVKKLRRREEGAHL